MTFHSVLFADKYAELMSSLMKMMLYVKPKKIAQMLRMEEILNSQDYCVMIARIQGKDPLKNAVVFVGVLQGIVDNNPEILQDLRKWLQDQDRIKG